MKLTLSYFQLMAIIAMLLLLPYTASAQTVNNGCIDGTVSSGQSVCPGTQPASLILSGNSGSVIKWQSSLTTDFSEPADIGTTSSVLSGDVIGAMTETTYFRAVVQSETCSFAASGYAMVAVKAVAPNVGSLSQFTLFTAAGAVSNTGATTINGDIGTNSGDITGFEAPAVINGSTQIANAATAQAAADINTLYTEVYNTPATNTGHTSVFGNGETLIGGVYAIQEAASVAGNITLDAQGDTDKVFILRALGAFTMAAGTTVTLTNGAVAANVFWVANGAITIAAGADIKGILVANGIISIESAATLHGNVYSVTGALSTYANSITPALPTGGRLLGGATICPNPDTVLTLTDYNGDIVKWQSSTASDFSLNIVDIINTTATLTAPIVTESTWFRAVIYGPGCTGERYSEPAALIIASTVWDGTSWSNGLPDASSALIFNAGFTATGNIEACTVVVNTGADVVVPAGYNMTVNGPVTVNGGTLTFENNASLVQIQDVSNTGSINVNQDSSLLYRLDYTIWTSPVTGPQTLKQFSQGTSDSRFYVYDIATDAYLSSLDGALNPLTETFQLGKGYLIRMPNTHTAPGYNAGTTPIRHEGVFTGNPNNGIINVPVSTAGVGFNAIGNPYPSPVSVWDFIDANSTNLVDGTLYLWRKKNNHNNLSYAAITKMAYAANTAEGGDTSGGAFSGTPQTWVLNQGQGFITKVAAGATSVVFNNAMRRDNNNGQFFRDGDSVEANDFSRIWLTLTGNESDFSQAVVGYTANATTGLDYGWDGKLLSHNGTTLYTKAADTNLIIQARPSFTDTDVVTLGYKAIVGGTYIITLANFDGVFVQGQDILLKDTYLGTVHNLKDSAYTFTSEAGNNNERFEVVYKNEPLLNTPSDGFTANNVIIYKKGTAVNIISGNAVMSTVKIYDIRGSLLYEASGINASELTINSPATSNQVLIVDIATDKGSTSKKILY